MTFMRHACMMTWWADPCANVTPTMWVMAELVNWLPNAQAERIAGIIQTVTMAFAFVMKGSNGIYTICEHHKAIDPFSRFIKYIFFFLLHKFSCIAAGTCGGVFCAENAVCQWDNIEKVQFCFCPEGFEGNGVTSCNAITPPCNVQNNCGVNAICTPNYR